MSRDEVSELREQVARLRAERDAMTRVGSLLFRPSAEEGVAQELLRGLVPVPVQDAELSVIQGGSGPNRREHLLFEGDNLASLSALSVTHAGSIDVIYIDPPYNTGNTHFVYNDKFSSTRGDRHSNWCAFMWPRLLLARDLLAEDGFMAVSISSVEVARLRLLCDEVFGESNFVADLIWRKNHSHGLARKDIANIIDHILIYRKSPATSFTRRAVDTTTRYRLEDENLPIYGRYSLARADVNSIAYDPAFDYPVEMNGTTYYAGGVSEEQWRKRLATAVPGRTGYPRWARSKAALQREIERGFIVERKGHLTKKVYERLDATGAVIPQRTVPRDDLLETITDTEGKLVPSITSQERNMLIPTTRLAALELRSIFGRGEVAFSYPKPTGLLKYLVNMHPNRDATVLDFFAGSGSTGHAVVDLNHEDGGQRTFILCTNNEGEAPDGTGGIARTVTAERLRRVLTGQWAIPRADTTRAYPDDDLHYYRMQMVAPAEVDSDTLFATFGFDAPTKVYSDGIIAGVKALSDRGALRRL